MKCLRKTLHPTWTWTWHIYRNGSATMEYFSGFRWVLNSKDRMFHQGPNRIETINWRWKAFSLLGMSSTTENAQKVHYILQIFSIYPVSIESSQFWSMWMTFNHLKSNSTKFAHYKLKIGKSLLSFLTFSPWYNIPFVLLGVLIIASVLFGCRINAAFLSV